MFFIFLVFSNGMGNLVVCRGGSLGEHAKSVRQIIQFNQRGQLYMFRRFSVTLAILFLLFCLPLNASQPSEFVYHNRWKQVVPQSLIIDANYESNNQQKCEGRPCLFYYYLYEDAALLTEDNRNQTVLLLSGMQGNDTLGPEVLLASYGKLAAGRIIYFPLANPSGWVRGTSVTFPQELDPLDDFPIRGSVDCNQTSAVRILRYLYQRYQVDLSVYVHGGQANVGFSWSGNYGQGSTVREHGIYRGLAEMIRYYGNREADELGLEEIGGGLVDSAGKYVDWAYGASKYPYILAETCGGRQMAKEPKDRMNGLVLSIGLGKIDSSRVDGKHLQNSIKRGLLLLKKMVSIANPQLILAIQGAEIDISIRGCKMGVLRNLTLSDSSGRVVFSHTEDMIINGDIFAGSVGRTGLNATGPLSAESDLTFVGNFKCNNDWTNQGSTSFAKIHEFRSRGLLVAYRVVVVEENGSYFGSQELDYCTVVVVVFLLVLIVTKVAGAMRTCLRSKLTRRSEMFGEKFQHVERVEGLYSVEDSFAAKGVRVLTIDSPRQG